MKTQLIKLQDKFILVSDEEIKEGDFVFQINFEKTNPQIIKIETEFQSRVANDKKGSYSKYKIIAGIPELPEIDFSLLSEEDCLKIGYIDVDYKLEDFEFERKKVYLETGSLTACTILDRGISLGFKTAQSLNDKMFSLEQLEWAFMRGALINQRTHNGESLTFSIERNKDIQSLQQTSWNVEVEMEEYAYEPIIGKFPNYKANPKPRLFRPKITNNSLKVVKITNKGV